MLEPKTVERSHYLVDDRESDNPTVMMLDVKPWVYDPGERTWKYDFDLYMDCLYGRVSYTEVDEQTAREAVTRAGGDFEGASRDESQATARCIVG